MNGQPQISNGLDMLTAVFEERRQFETIIITFFFTSLTGLVWALSSLTDLRVSVAVFVDFAAVLLVIWWCHLWISFTSRIRWQICWQARAQMPLDSRYEWFLVLSNPLRDRGVAQRRLFRLIYFSFPSLSLAFILLIYWRFWTAWCGAGSDVPATRLWLVLFASMFSSYFIVRIALRAQRSLDRLAEAIRESLSPPCFVCSLPRALDRLGKALTASPPAPGTSSSPAALPAPSI